MNEPRPRCTHCGHRVARSGHCTIARDGVESAYCTHRAACRRASHGAANVPSLAEASTEAYGAALIASDYVTWPWWARLMPQSARDEVATRLARLTSAAVERRVLADMAGSEVAPNAD